MTLVKDAVALISLVLVPLIAAVRSPCPVKAQSTATPYSSMAPLAQYMMERNAEIGLAQSAAPLAISSKARVLVMGPHGYAIAIKGENGFVCAVQRSWTAGADDPDFWNPKLRAPICFNPAASRSQLPILLKKTELILNGASKIRMFDAVKAGFEKGELVRPETGSMCYMMSKQGYLSDRDGNWHPHLMFFVPLTETASWGAELPGSPIAVAVKVPLERMTVFLIPVGGWSDGTLDPKPFHGR